MDYEYIRAEGKAGRMSQKLMAIVAEGTGREETAATQIRVVHVGPAETLRTCRV